MDYLERSHCWEEVRDKRWSVGTLLDKIDASHVDGGSRYPTAIHEITRIETCDGAGGP